MIPMHDGKRSRRPVRWLAFTALCLVSLAATAQGGHGGGGHGGGGHGGYSAGRGIGHGGGYSGGHGIGHRGGHFGGYHGGGHVFFGLGYWPWYYPPLYSYYPYYSYYPQTYAVQGSSPVYVERGDEQQSANWWYYCANPQGYYPYVRQCPGGWQPVSPEPPR